MAFPILYTKQTIYPAMVTFSNQLHLEHEDTSGTFCYDKVFNGLIRDLYPDFPGDIVDMTFDKLSSFYQMWDPGDSTRFITNFRAFVSIHWHNFRYDIENDLNDCTTSSSIDTTIDNIFEKKLTRMKVLCNFFNIIITLRSTFDSICRLNKDLRDFAADQSVSGMTPVPDDPKVFPPLLNGWMEGLVLTFTGNLEEEFIQASDTAKDKMKSLFNYSLSQNTPFTIAQVDKILKNLYLVERKIIQQKLNDIVMESAKINFDWAINRKEGVVKYPQSALSIINNNKTNKQYWSVYSNNVEQPIEDINTYYKLFINGLTDSENPNFSLPSIVWYNVTTPYDNNQ